VKSVGDWVVGERARTRRLSSSVVGLVGAVTGSRQLAWLDLTSL